MPDDIKYLVSISAYIDIAFFYLEAGEKKKKNENAHCYILKAIKFTLILGRRNTFFEMNEKLNFQERENEVGTLCYNKSKNGKWRNNFFFILNTLFLRLLFSFFV